MRRAILLVLPLVVAVQADGRASGDQRLLAERSVAEIHKSMLAVHNRVRSLEIRYCVCAAMDHAGDPGRQSRHFFAVKDHLRFRENVHFSPDRPASVDMNHTKQYFTGESADVYYVNSRYYETSRNSASLVYASKIRFDPILACLGWWPENDERPGDDLADKPQVYLRFALACSGYCLRPKLEPVDGSLCCVVEAPTLDRIWLDPRKGFAIRKRETCDPLSGAIVRRQTSSQFREWATNSSQEHGFWIPARIRVENWNRNGDATHFEISVEDVRVNQVDDSLFKFTPLPGTLVVDRDTDSHRQVPGGEDLLDHTVEIAQQLLDVTGSAGRKKSKNIRIQSLALSAVWTVVSVLAISVYVKRLSLRPYGQRASSADAHNRSV